MNKSVKVSKALLDLANTAHRACPDKDLWIVSAYTVRIKLSKKDDLFASIRRCVCDDGCQYSVRKQANDQSLLDISKRAKVCESLDEVYEEIRIQADLASI